MHNMQQTMLICTHTAAQIITVEPSYVNVTAFYELQRWWQNVKTSEIHDKTLTYMSVL